MDMVIQMNNKIARNTPIEKDLKASLFTLREIELIKIGFFFEKFNLNKKSKKELVDIIYRILIKKKNIIDIISKLIDSEVDLLDRLIKNNGTIEEKNERTCDYLPLNKYGMVYLYKEKDIFYISMPDEIYNIVKEINLDELKEKIDENTKIYYLIRSMVQLYGVVQYDDFNDSYEKFYNKKSDDEKYFLLMYCSRFDNISVETIDDENCYVHPLLAPIGAQKKLKEVLKGIKKISRKPIELEQLLKYGDYDYYQNNNYINQFKNYLRAKKIGNEAIDQTIVNMLNMYKLGDDVITATFGMLQEYGVKVMPYDVNKLLPILRNIYNNTIVWRNNGWTPSELKSGAAKQK